MTCRFLRLAYVFILIFSVSCTEGGIKFSSSQLRCEYQSNPIGIDVLSPRLSWVIEAEGRNKRQTAYRILVASNEANLKDDIGDLWDSQKVSSDETINIKYRGKELSSRTNCYWKVMVWDEEGIPSNWSKVGHWSMGLLEVEDWKGQWIGFDEAWPDSTTYGTKPWANNMRQKKDYRPLPCPYFRKEFIIDQPITSANAYVTALGVYELYINGERVGDDYFTPGWTDYRKRIYYNTYDVGALLHKGRNTIAAILADGWYAGNIANRGQYYYGDQLRLRAQINIDYDDGSEAFFATDSNWKASYGPHLEADMQGGETYDARLEMEGWNANGFDDSNWKSVAWTDSTTVVVQAYPGRTVKVIKEIKPVELFELKNGVYIVNMGQNFAGRARIELQGEKGDSVIMRFAEKLNLDGSLHTRNLRTARCTDTYVLKGTGTEIWEPTFTYHGYQYIEVTGYPGVLTLDKITGIVLHTDLPKTGEFTCSNDLMNRIYNNIIWSQRSNYFEVPTDNPQRDERMGWTGDAQLFMRSASYNMDIASFFTKWLVDIADGQFEDGRFPSTAPRIYGRVASGWGDAGIICPWNMLNLYNDTTVVKKFYPHMTMWMDYLEETSDDYISTMGSFGDWQNVDSETPIDVIATAYFKRCTDLMAEMAEVISKEEDVKRYTLMSANIKKAFNERFVNDSVKVSGHTQTGYLLTLSFDLLPEAKREEATNHLLETIKSADNHLTTGILGTNLLLPTLTKTGNLDLAYELLLNTDYPSWGYHVKNGATTIWERWDSFSKQSGFHKDSTNSLNQYAYGSIGEWMFSTVAGIDMAEPGYKHIIIRPRPGGKLTHAKADYESIRGMISSSWKIEEDQFSLDVTIPPNTMATVFIPADKNSVVMEGEEPVDKVDEIHIMGQDSGSMKVQIGSGSYQFKVLDKGS